MARFTYEDPFRRFTGFILFLMLVTFVYLGTHLWGLIDTRSNDLNYIDPFINLGETPKMFVYHQPFVNFVIRISGKSIDLLFWTTCTIVMILSSYWSSFVEDKKYVLNEHFDLVHHTNRTSTRKSREKRYWQGVEESEACDTLARFLFVMRLWLCFYCTAVLRQEAVYLCILHTIRLLLVCIKAPEGYNRWVLIVKTLFHYSQHAEDILNFRFPLSVRIKLTHRFFERLLAIFVLLVRQFTSVNGHFCAICDYGFPDVWTAVILPDRTELGDHQGDGCAFCWDNWTVGDIATVFKCGHVFHKECNKRWSRKKRSQICPVCRFRVEVKEGRQPPRRREYSNEDIARMREMRRQRVETPTRSG